MCLSREVLGGCSVSSLGILFPILVFRSPHSIVWCYGCKVSSMSSNCVVAESVVVLRFSKD